VLHQDIFGRLVPESSDLLLGGEWRWLKIFMVNYIMVFLVVIYGDLM
jgi:hypothetical protein